MSFSFRGKTSADYVLADVSVRSWTDADSVDTWKMQGADLEAPVGGPADTAAAANAMPEGEDGCVREGEDGCVRPASGLAPQLPAGFLQDSQTAGAGTAAPDGGGSENIMHTIVLKPGDLRSMDQLPGVIQEMQRKLGVAGGVAGSSQGNMRP